MRHVIDTNVTGTIYLIQKVGRDMRARGKGRILITGSIAGFMPGTYQAVYNGTKAFLDSFSFALRDELKDTGVTVTCLMPGATETEFFERADMMDTKVGQAKKDDPADVAKTGFDAMMRGDGDVVTGWKNKLQTAIASVTPAGILAGQHAAQAAPGSARVEAARAGRRHRPRLDPARRPLPVQHRARAGREVGIGEGLGDQLHAGAEADPIRRRRRSRVAGREQHLERWPQRPHPFGERRPRRRRAGSRR